MTEQLGLTQPLPETKHEVVRVVTSAPALLVAHLQALGATVAVPLLPSAVTRGGRVYEMEQDSVDLPAVAGVALHLIVASEPQISSVAEFRARVAARRAAQGGAA